VSHSAAYRHFADREALLAEVSRHARSELAAEMRRRVVRAKSPRQRLRAVGTAYIDFALREPGLYRAAFTSHPATSPVADQERAGAGSSGDGAEPFDILREALDQCESAGLLNPHRRPGAEIAVWSAVHGLAGLLLDGPLPRSAAGIEFARRQVMELIERGLLDGGSS
jgi:AcrR family transcriptional regulator